MAFNYYIPTRILFGHGKLEQLHQQVLPGKKCLIVTTAGQSVIRFGYLSRLEEQLKKAGIEYVVFNKILPNPIKDHVMEGASIAKEKSCDFIIGLGGGSSIDSAKSIAVMATNEGDYWDYIGGGSGRNKPVVNKPLPIIAITTTAGTGTEADPWTVITHGKEKIGFGYDHTFPYLSIVDSSLMLSVPKMLTAYQGFDALFHSTEGYINIRANEISDLYSLKAIELIGKYLPTAVNDGSNIIARDKVALANTLSGFVESTSGCTSEHSMEHAMSAYHPSLEHGAGLIMVSAAYYSIIAKSGVCNERMIDMAKALGKTDAKEAMDFVVALVDLQKSCGVDNLKMSDYEIKESELKEMAANAFYAMGGLFEVDPYKFTETDVLEVFKSSYK